MRLSFSFIVPVFNRPNEIQELLESMLAMEFAEAYEIVIIEDGSTDTAEHVVKDFEERLNISYYQKPNTGPGDSRNFGMRHAKGNYFIILDSDVVLPENYLLGGIRGRKKNIGKFQPRSFNMGLSKEAFEASQGFDNIHPGEDPDLTIRLWKLGYQTALIPEAKVFHKRRISWSKFYTQVHKFGLVRPILNSWHPETAKLTYWFPSLFLGFIVVALISMLYGYWQLLALLAIYIFLIFVGAMFKYKSILIAIQAVIAVFVQFYGYGKGFLKSYYYIQLLKRAPEKQFAMLFFSK